MKIILHSKGFPSRNIIRETGMVSNSVIVKNVDGKSEYIDNKKESRRVYSRILVTCSNSQKGELMKMKPKEKHSRIMHLVSENNKMIGKRVVRPKSHHHENLDTVVTQMNQKKIEHKIKKTVNRLIENEDEEIKTYNCYPLNGDKRRNLFVPTKKSQTKGRNVSMQINTLPRQAFRLAKLHYTIVVLKHCLKAWKHTATDSNWKFLKALNYYQDKVFKRAFEALASFAQSNCKKKLEKERIRLKLATEYYSCCLCEGVIKLWRKRIESNRNFYTTVSSRLMSQQKIRVIFLWKCAQERQVLFWLRKEKEAFIIEKLRVMKKVLKMWKLSCITKQKEKFREKEIIAKWDKVQEWLACSSVV